MGGVHHKRPGVALGFFRHGQQAQPPCIVAGRDGFGLVNDEFRRLVGCGTQPGGSQCLVDQFAKFRLLHRHLHAYFTAKGWDKIHAVVSGQGIRPQFGVQGRCVGGDRQGQTVRTVGFEQ